MRHRMLMIMSVVLTLVSATLAADRDKPFVIHEWGTFTVLQDEQGNPLAGVNINEEPLPPFTHRLYRGLIREGQFQSPLFRSRSKGIPASFSAATMRMETPVIYLYPPSDEPTLIDIGVRFQGGWISEWYPNAKVDAPGFNARRHDLGTLSPAVQGSIQWDQLTVNSEAAVPETDEHVWLAPREVRAPVLHTQSKEAENYLFYRGVATIDAPLRVVRDEKRDRLMIKRNHSVGKWENDLQYSALWLVDIREDGSVAYRRLPATSNSDDEQLVSSTQASFGKQDYSKSHLGELRDQMKRALVSEGLFEDEAEAMLNTWELSYFKSSGLRLFFTLPRDWTDRILPMDVSREAEIERVMIGRIELVTPEQRKILRQMNQLSASGPGWFWEQFEQRNATDRTKIWRALTNGTKELTDFDFEIPADYAQYLRLGRFRESLVLNASKEKASEGLRQFVANYRITGT